MSEIEIIKLVFGILLSIGSFVLIFLAFFLAYKYLVQEKKCTEKTKGKVVKYTLTSKGESGIFLPIFKYVVDGKEYKVKGPEYKSYITISVSSPLSENNQEFYEDEKQRFVLKRTSNSVVSIHQNPMAKLYPIGSEEDIFYNPQNPKLAYVKRYCNLKWVFWLMFVVGIAIAIIDLLILFLL